VNLVEKTLEKMNAAGGDVVAKARPATRLAGPLVAEVRPDVRVTLADPLPGEAPKRTVHIDEQALMKQGVLAPEGEARRVADEYRAIKRSIIDTAFQPQSASHEARLVAITSALPGDGKTHTSINLALSLALEKDHSVVLVDADVAKPHVSRLLGVSDVPGLLDLLASPEISLRSVLLPTSRPNLWVLPAGAPSEVATELLASDRMQQLREDITAMLPRAIILLDSSPVLVTSEAPVVVSGAGQILLVVKAGETQEVAVLDAIAKIGHSDKLKLILNQAPVSRLSGYYDGRWYEYGAAYAKQSKGGP
jgi:protein-tyrosine kinase